MPRSIGACLPLSASASKRIWMPPCLARAVRALPKPCAGRSKDLLWAKVLPAQMADTSSARWSGLGITCSPVFRWYPCLRRKTSGNPDIAPQKNSTLADQRVFAPLLEAQRQDSNQRLQQPFPVGLLEHATDSITAQAWIGQDSRTSMVAIDLFDHLAERRCLKY